MFIILNMFSRWPLVLQSEGHEEIMQFQRMNLRIKQVLIIRKEVSLKGKD